MSMCTIVLAVVLTNVPALGPLGSSAAALISAGSNAGSTGQPTTAPATDYRARTKDQGLPNAFFAMDTATKDDTHRTTEEQVRMIKELGYAGWGPAGTQNVPEMLEALDRYGLKMFALYVGVNLDPDQPKYDPKLKDVIAALKGRDTILWVFVRSQKHLPGSADGNAKAVEILRDISDMARPAGVRVALYPHFGFYVSKVSEAVSLADKIDRKNVGVTFNLCHWLRGEKGDDLEQTLERAMPRLFVVTINGADRQADSWDRLIQPLGRGDFDVCGLLKTLNGLGYRGPIGFQGYGIKGDIRQVLAQTMAAWKDYAERCHR